MEPRLRRCAINKKDMPNTHTPGPYAVETNVIAGGVIHLAITNRNNGAEWMICSVTPMDRARPIDFANARLIAAAPALLAACKGAIAALSQNATFPADVDAAKLWLSTAVAQAEKEEA